MTAAAAADASGTSSATATLDLYAKSRSLYLSALRARRELLDNPNHPDLVSTKFSLAELMSSMGLEDDANRIRGEILEGYDMEERDVPKEEGEETRALLMSGGTKTRTDGGNDR